MVKADYVYTITDDDFVNIVDLNRGNKSVTNDAENILTEINHMENIKSKRIVYIDSNEELCEMIPSWKNEKCISVKFKNFND